MEKELNLSESLNMSDTDSKAIGTTTVPYIIQNGKIYQLTSNNQLISRSSIELNHPILTTATSNLTCNENKPQQTIQQMPNQLSTAKLTIPIATNTQPQITKNIPNSLQNTKIIMKPQMNNNELNVQVINTAVGQQYNQHPSQITQQVGNQAKIIISGGQTTTNKQLILMTPSNQTQQKINLPLAINKNIISSNSKLHALINKNQSVSLNSAFNSVVSKSSNVDENHQLKTLNALPVANSPNSASPPVSIKNTTSITPVIHAAISTTKASSSMASPLLTTNTVQSCGKKVQNLLNHQQQQITPVINKDNPSKSTTQTLNLTIDENFLSEASIGELNEFILPDTRIFASLLNKTGQQSSSNKVGNNKRTLDLTYKTAVIGQTEHVILDNQNNLSDYKGNLVQLQNLACLIANQLKKPVTIPAFLLIEQDNIEEIKSLFNEKNVNPIVIETQMPNNNENKVSNTLKPPSKVSTIPAGANANENHNNLYTQINNQPTNHPNALPHYLVAENSLIAKRLSEPIEDLNAKRVNSQYEPTDHNTKEIHNQQMIDSSTTSANQKVINHNLNSEIINNDSGFQQPSNSLDQNKDFSDLQSVKMTAVDSASSLEPDDLNFDSFDANLFINFSEQMVS